MAEYLFTSVIGPCSLIVEHTLDTHGSIHTELLKPCKFRFKSCVAHALLKTYKILGHMVPIPATLEAWCFPLYHVLTAKIIEIDGFKKMNAEHYTCTNIPLLVVILVLLERKGVVCFKKNQERLSAAHHSKGSWVQTRTYRKKGINNWPRTSENQSWNLNIPFKVTVQNKEVELHEFIHLLLHGKDCKDMPGLKDIKIAKFKKEVHLAMTHLLVTEGITIDHMHYLARHGKKPAQKTASEPVEVESYTPNPFFTQAELKGLFKDEKIERDQKIELLENLQADAMARLTNITVHLAHLNKNQSPLPPSEKEVEETVTANLNKAQKTSCTLGELKYLIKPNKKDPSSILTQPPLFGQTSKLKKFITDAVEETTVDLGKPNFWSYLTHAGRSCWHDLGDTNMTGRLRGGDTFQEQADAYQKKMAAAEWKKDGASYEPPASSEKVDVSSPTQGVPREAGHPPTSPTRTSPRIQAAKQRTEHTASPDDEDSDDGNPLSPPRSSSDDDESDHDNDPVPKKKQSMTPEIKKIIHEPSTPAEGTRGYNEKRVSPDKDKNEGDPFAGLLTLKPTASRKRKISPGSGKSGKNKRS
jgi:hypothetical protein